MVYVSEGSEVVQVSISAIDLVFSLFDRIFYSFHLIMRSQDKLVIVSNKSNIEKIVF